MTASGMLDRGDGVHLAWSRTAGRGPTVVFLPGFKSDMAGEKATDLARWSEARGRAMLRFDYSGHGASGGRFEDGTIGRWRDDALAAIDGLTDGKLLLVGSSMGGWIALLAARERPDRLTGLVGVAAAPDFTETLMWESMTPPERAMLARNGVLLVPSQYGEPYPITRTLIEEGRSHRLLDGPIALACPVRLLHGQRDADVPWELSLQTAAQITTDDVQVILVKDGDHRLSRPSDLALLRQTVASLLGEDGP